MDKDILLRTKQIDFASLKKDINIQSSFTKMRSKILEEIGYHRICNCSICKIIYKKNPYLTEKKRLLKEDIRVPRFLENPLVFDSTNFGRLFNRNKRSDYLDIARSLILRWNWIAISVNWDIRYLESNLYEEIGIWWNPELNIVCQPPIEIHMEEIDNAYRFHKEDGPALLWANGFGECFWKGNRIDSKALGDFSVQDILNEKNQETRRVMIERYGATNLIKDVNADLIHEDKFGKLYRLKIGRDVLKMVHVVCPSTQREYWLRVPPTFRKAQSAVAWTAGFDWRYHEYNPIVET